MIDWVLVLIYFILASVIQYYFLIYLLIDWVNSMVVFVASSIENKFSYSGIVGYRFPAHPFLYSFHLFAFILIAFILSSPQLWMKWAKGWACGVSERVSLVDLVAGLLLCGALAAAAAHNPQRNETNQPNQLKGVWWGLLVSFLGLLPAIGHNQQTNQRRLAPKESNIKNIITVLYGPPTIYCYNIPMANTVIISFIGLFSLRRQGWMKQT